MTSVQPVSETHQVQTTELAVARNFDARDGQLSREIWVCFVALLPCA